MSACMLTDKEQAASARHCHVHQQIGTYRMQDAFLQNKVSSKFYVQGKFCVKLSTRSTQPVWY